MFDKLLSYEFHICTPLFLHCFLFILTPERTLKDDQYFSSSEDDFVKTRLMYFFSLCTPRWSVISSVFPGSSLVQMLQMIRSASQNKVHCGLYTRFPAGNFDMLVIHTSVKSSLTSLSGKLAFIFVEVQPSCVCNSDSVYVVAELQNVSLGSWSPLKW